MKKTIILAAVVATTGCSTTPNYDQRFGEAVRVARMAQVINPNAGSNPDQASGIDGQAAREAMGRYLQTFKEPPPVVNVINIGGAIGSK